MSLKISQYIKNQLPNLANFDVSLDLQNTRNTRNAHVMKYIYNLLILAFLIVTFALTSSCSGSFSGKDKISFYCNPDNDLYLLLQSKGLTCKLYDDINEAIENTSSDQTLLILARDYPMGKTVIPENFFQKVQEKNLKVYLEYPDHLSEGKTGEVIATNKERIVVSSDFFGEKMPQMKILDAGLFTYIQVSERPAFLRGGKVAGFKEAMYGLENTPNFPVLFEDHNVLISTTKLSDFIRSRYAPYQGWQRTIGAIIRHLDIEVEEALIKWSPVVKPAYDKDEVLAEKAFESAVQRGADWYVKGRFLIHQDWVDRWRKIDTLPLPVGPPISFTLPSGDGSLGVMEGHYSYINPDGSQPYRYWLRADCVSETAMTFAIANSVKGSREGIKIATNLMDFLFNSNAFITESSKDPTKSSYGLIGWADTHKSRYYGDDNARVILGAILAAAMLENDKWDQQLAELIVANFRTSGYKGFRSGALMGDFINQTGWQTLMERDLEHIAPHYESWLWATYLWLYDKTNYKPLLEKAKRAIAITMDNYPENWTWTNGIQQERARMILPLAWLVRVEDTQKHRDWLNLICDALLENQVACGALQEELGEGDKGRYGTPKSNDHYGSTEAPVIHNNGDPLADMLYTTNFAFFALNEAAQATQNQNYLNAVDRLAEFLVRIQSTSSGRADLDGCWFRSFDYQNWEYYGSNADHGWGAWGTLTGWTQSFITTTLALKLHETSYWEITKASGVGNSMDKVLEEMLPGINLPG